MKTSQKIILGVLAGFVVVLGLWFMPASQPAATEFSSHASPMADPGKTAYKTPIVQSPGAVPITDRPSPIAIEKFRDKTLYIYEHRRSVDRNQKMEEQYTTLAQDPEAIRIASMIVGDPAASTELFADDQAYARVFAIGLLDHLAKNGQTAYLEDSVHRIGKHLAAKGSRAKGVDADYVDLLSSYIRHRGIESIADNPEDFLQKISYSQAMVLDVEKAFYDSGTLRSITPEQSKILSRYFTTKSASVSQKEETH